MTHDQTAYDQRRQLIEASSERNRTIIQTMDIIPVISPMVRWVEIDRVVFILDLEHEAYHALEPEFTDSWRSIAQSTDGKRNHQMVSGGDRAICYIQ